MKSTTTKSAYWQGVRGGLPFTLMTLPVGLLFGVVAHDAGLQLLQVFGFSLLVIAGAAQFAALQLMSQDASILLVLLAALAVNLRMAMYSAALVPHLGAAPLWQRALVAYANFDQTYIVSITQYETTPDWSVAQKAAYFLGVATPLTPTWVGTTVLGALVGSAIPPQYGFDFIVPIMFLAMVAPMLRTSAHMASMAVAIVMALLLAGLPSGVGLLIAAACAMVTGVVVETWAKRRT
jgi:4-azaleucine resistance transporter AzlC